MINEALDGFWPSHLNHVAQNSITYSFLRSFCEKLREDSIRIELDI